MMQILGIPKDLKIIRNCINCVGYSSDQRACFRGKRKDPNILHLGYASCGCMINYIGKEWTQFVCLLINLITANMYLHVRARIYVCMYACERNVCMPASKRER